MAQLNKLSDDYQILLKTIFAECREEPVLGQKAVAWVIKNRADQNCSYWGGNTIAGVCLHPRQFECWNADKCHLIEDMIRKEPGVYAKIDSWLPTVYLDSDPSGGADHYNNPEIEGYSPGCYRLQKIGNRQFYRVPYGI